MLDTHARKYVQPLIETTASSFLKIGLTANQVTMISFLIGLSSGILFYFDYAVAAIVVLWISGFLDAVDGTMARKTNVSPWGTVMDVTFDRVVEISVILGIAFKYPHVQWALLLLSASIIFSITVFLTVGAVSEKKGMKSFYYQAGLAERTEGFLFFSFMMLLPNYVLIITLLFFVVEMFTGLQRLHEARQLLH
ncbi:CDP-alcohol phosphatidyltransferase family protein [Anoxybacillus sp. LAT_35]|uniref:CDP-alcohol phosphatidyltransferase family protein n=1 Tax=Anoxybacillus TaxID=150247 RepID=UPI001EDA2E1D|nr:CDP-alcohol phosphatidyltransferase family protein [Anoxybacillus sp. LAT_26]MCG3084346.1 CDP-alcohol phosphatidyltransferase family protein [Anoxybacillus sp. LAT27]MCG5026347.1 CDP-alcohol phosphatidyltransferase family protein [Anoxybacillus flavithermus]MCG6170995.1 CDP-alcohol phosphatidyltransferase family protein [Anoxybacillus sp. LAT_11]MCG6176049.1 CDP-alcohol phosphatidyltransferase family protein [Anoxybacillus sp. LAT_31]MCG6178322.1 CDP-alcohol phosphatidyltransferase family p